VAIDVSIPHTNFVQPGPPRSVDMISQQLDEQIQLSMLGVERPISLLQTATGTKDPIVQYWINILLLKAQQLKAASPDRSGQDIAMELHVWFDEQPGDKKNPLLSVLGTNCHSIGGNNILIFNMNRP
jgi:hypothetical protein